MKQYNILGGVDRLELVNDTFIVKHRRKLLRRVRINRSKQLKLF